MRIPASTYRLQLHASFDFERATAVLDYIRDLGADWVYLSPVLQAELGSTHGYDVVDHENIDAERGGEDGLRQFSEAAHALGLGVLIDIVPNHMGVATPPANAWWWDLLKYGKSSRFADAFDVDWEAGRGKIRIPVLGDDAAGDAAGELGKLRIDTSGDESVLTYYDNRYPLAPGTLSAPTDDPATVHSRQNYELVNWRRADAELNYRRFFAVNSLAGVRVEEPWVFDDSHSEIKRWFVPGTISGDTDAGHPIADGLRVDHPDGLADPEGYLDRLAAVTGGGYTVVEKILEPGEDLPGNWACSGTTGYDALGDFDRVLIDPAGQSELDRLDAELRGGGVDWLDLIHDTKRAVADGILRSEVLRLARSVPAIPQDAAADALAELMANFPVYRSYLPGGSQYLFHAVAESTRRRPDLAGTLEALLPTLRDPTSPTAVRFQQTSGMVMAKGVEDCAFYRYTRLTSLTEVGGDPSTFSIDPQQFHDRQKRRLPHANSMTTLSTHDTKRSENVRARLDVLSEVPGVWSELVTAVRRDTALDDGPLANLLLQAIVGSWPAAPERLHAYAEKAAREAGNSTLWTAPNAAFEQSMHDFVDYCLASPAVKAFVDRIAAPAASNILSAKLLQLMAPGVPDVYQGSELGDENSLVDPDNRRAVDFDALRAALARIDAGEIPAPGDPAAKLLVTSRTLRLRRDRPRLFDTYRRATTFGSQHAHLLGFTRGNAVALATRLPVGLAASGGWKDSYMDLDGRSNLRYVDVFTRREHSVTPKLTDVFADLPVALLVPKRYLR